MSNRRIFGAVGIQCPCLIISYLPISTERSSGSLRLDTFPISNGTNVLNLPELFEPPIYIGGFFYLSLSRRQPGCRRGLAGVAARPPPRAFRIAERRPGFFGHIRVDIGMNSWRRFRPVGHRARCVGGFGYRIWRLGRRTCRDLTRGIGRCSLCHNVKHLDNSLKWCAIFSPRRTDSFPE